MSTQTPESNSLITPLPNGEGLGVRPFLSSRYDNADVMYRRCGKSGVMLPKISLGFWHNFGGVDPMERSREITRYAFDHGITHFDLANNYGPPYGSAEETLGRLMDSDFRPYRDELFISTKAGYDMWPGPYGNWGSRKYLMASLDQSLKRMHLDYVDLFYSHRYDPNTPLEETLQALVAIVRQGKAGILDYCHTHGIGFISFSPLAQGLLTDRYLNGIPADSRMAKEHFLKHSALTPELLAKIKAWNQEAGKRGETLAEMALAWILHQQGITSVLVGASSVAQLEKNMKCISAPAFDGLEL